jgi:hypothetical protein
MRNLPAVLTLAALSSLSATAGVRAAPLLLPPFKAGETITYSDDDQLHNTQAGPRFVDSRQSMKFDVNVQQVTEKGAHIVFILRDRTASGDYDSGGQFLKRSRMCRLNWTSTRPEFPWRSRISTI